MSSSLGTSGDGCLYGSVEDIEELFKVNRETSRQKWRVGDYEVTHWDSIVCRGDNERTHCVTYSVSRRTPSGSEDEQNLGVLEGGHVEKEKRRLMQARKKDGKQSVEVGDEKEQCRGEKKKRKRCMKEALEEPCEEMDEAENSEEGEQFNMQAMRDLVSQNIHKMFSPYHKKCAFRWHSPKFRRIRDYWNMVTEKDLKAARTAGRAYKVNRAL
eukprot:GHVS01087472.1.p1 GENE.GHVS01087472.1~~GHVS01087472.1.p1  ORF type:complete len:213 (-),score=36.82 GHVS01087472.1:161-799(-)